MKEPQMGDTGHCETCHERLVYTGLYWDHVGEMKPKHPAVPMERHTVEMQLDLDAMEQHIRLAHDKVRALCLGDERWTMRIPADRDYDHDLIISAALHDADKLLLAVRSLMEQRGTE